MKLNYPDLTSKNEFSEWDDYSTLTGFEQIYLEDSYVLSIDNLSDEICFSMEFTLTECHPFE